MAVVLPEAMTGDWAVGRLARAGIYVSSTHVPSADGPAAALRLGTQELVTRGFGPTDMGEIATLVTRALGEREAPCEVRAEVTALRQRTGR